jgi:hypothetical protein
MFIAVTAAVVVTYPIGTTVEVVGLFVALAGLLRTWRDFAPKGEPIYGRELRLLQALGRRLRTALAEIRRRVTRSPRGRHIALEAAISGTGELNVTVRRGYGPLLSDLSAAEAMAVLDQRTRELMDRIEDASGAAREEGARAAAAERLLEKRVAEVASSAASNIQRVATEGLRIELFGLALVAIGLVLQNVIHL